MGIGSRLVIKLKVFDFLRKEVVTLVITEQKFGNYEVKFNASGLTLGKYFLY